MHRTTVEEPPLWTGVCCYGALAAAFAQALLQDAAAADDAPWWQQLLTTVQRKVSRTVARRTSDLISGEKRLPPFGKACVLVEKYDADELSCTAACELRSVEGAEPS